MATANAAVGRTLLSRTGRPRSANVVRGQTAEGSLKAYHSFVVA